MEKRKKLPTDRRRLLLLYNKDFFFSFSCTLQVISRLLTICHLAVVLLDYSDVGNLFAHDCVVDDMMVDFEKINRECFYGRSFGFQVPFKIL